MSERTTIGGTVYESVGSSSSNLLLKCNGTARIQWGSKLIDLIKNGKIASGSDSEQVFVISDQSEIKSDGIYVLNTDENPQLIVCKKGEQYNLTGTDLYISASSKQDITAEQQKQALENIGIYYNTLEDVNNSGIQNGLVYVLENKTLYTITEGVISEFEAKVKTVTVEQEKEEGEVINSSVKVVLSVQNLNYLVLENNRVTILKDVHIKEYAKLGSENADDTSGYRLYISGGQSFLDVDNINVRNGLPIKEYIKVTCSNFQTLIKSKKLESQMWYLLSDFQNHWRLPANSVNFNRPILIKASSSESLYEEGCLFNDRRILIHYDPFYNDAVSILNSSGQSTGTSVKARGKITWMKDVRGNEANFDFLDYEDYLNKPLTTLHAYAENSSIGKTIFPANSYNNKLTVRNLKGTVLNNGLIDNTNTGSVSFNCIMYDNVLEVENISINCYNFYKNTFNSIKNLNVTKSITNSSFGDVIDCVFNSSMNKVRFESLYRCTFGPENLSNIICRSDIEDASFSATTDPLLYDSSTYKEVFFKNGKLYYLGGDTQIIPRGTIVMHSGLDIATIPKGWAICDGGTYTYNGISTQTPNLVGRFIKAVSTVTEVKSSDNYPDNNLTLTTDYLPPHTHPHETHTHTFSGSTSVTALTGATQKRAITAVEGGTQGNVGDDTTSSSITISISGTTGATESKEKAWQYKNTPTAIKIEPNYYSLIFIMKL